MSLGFAAPWALAALAALALPILAHLVRRAEHRVTPFAALRFLRAAGLPRRRIRLAELALLALRMALVAAAVLWLAQPFVRRPLEASRVVAVATSVPRDAVRDVLGVEPGREAIWLAPGFPPLSDAPPAGVQPLASLVRELDGSLVRDATLALVVPELIAGLDGARPVLSRDVAWHVVPIEPDDAAAPRDTIRVGWLVAAEHPAARYLAAAAAAWRAAPALAIEPVAIAAEAAMPDGLDAVVWAGGRAPPALDAWVAQGGSVLAIDAVGGAFGPDAAREAHRGQRSLPQGAGATGRVVVRDDVGAPLVLERAHGRGIVRWLARPLDPAAWPIVHDAAFPAQLRAWLARDPPAPTRAVADALRPATGDVAAAAPPRAPLAPWLALAVATLFLVERAWAAGLARRRSA